MRARAWHGAHGESPTVSAALAAAAQTPPAYEHNQGHVLIALQNAFYQALHASSVEEEVVTAQLPPFVRRPHPHKVHLLPYHEALRWLFVHPILPRRTPALRTARSVLAPPNAPLATHPVGG
jgi:hypothetical protein